MSTPNRYPSSSLPVSKPYTPPTGGGFLRAYWKQALAMGALGLLLYKADFRYALLPSSHPRAQAAALVLPDLIGGAEGDREKPVRKVNVRSKAESQKGRVQVAGLDDLNLANEATATGAALTESQKELAARLSNLTLVLDPGYAKRNNLDQAVVREKMRICTDYIRKYLDVAREEARQFNIPVAITLAQGLLESNAGDSRLAVKANNHFGIKCFSRTCRKGHCMNATDDSHKDFFLIFESGKDCFRARSRFLSKDRYKHLQKLPRSDYRKWAHGLKKAGYATDPQYARKLIAIIENLKLYVYDQN